MLKIRLARTWKKNSPFYRVVLTEHTAPCKSGYKEVLGHFNPMSKEFKLKDVEKVKTFISHWAQFKKKKKKLIKTNNIAL